MPKSDRMKGSITAVWLIVIVLAAIAPYIPSMKGEFVLDDQDLIVNAPMVHSLGNFKQVFSARFLPECFGKDIMYYRPLVTLSYQVNYALSGLHPFPYRATNVLMDALAAVLVFFLVLRLTRSALASGVAGTVFAVLPCHVEPVGWISGRTDVMAAVFLLAALLVFIRTVSASGGFSWPRALGCSALFACALLSKENALVAPALMAGYVWLICEPQRRREFWRHDAWRWAVVLLPPLIVYLALRKHVIGAAMDKYICFMLWQRLAGIGIVYAAYLRMLFVPQEARVIYDVFPIGIKYPAIAAVAWLVPTSLIALVVWLRRRQPAVAFGIFWILICLLPVSNILPVFGPLPAERFAYMASIGSSVVLGWLAMKAWMWRPKAIRVWPAVAVLLIFSFVANCAALAVSGSRYWRTNVEWARGVAETNTRFEEIQVVSASIFASAGYRALRTHNFNKAAIYYMEAARGYERAIRTAPKDISNYVCLADIRMVQGNPREAIRVLTDARAFLGPRAGLSLHLAMAYQKAGMKADAVRECENVLSLSPRSRLATQAQSLLRAMEK